MQRKVERQVIKISKSSKSSSISHECWIINIIFVLVYCCLHSFYPNFSKFLQQNYGYTNNEAGHLSSIPYVLSSVLVPLFGQVLSFIKPEHYVKFLCLGMGFIGTAHFIFLALLTQLD